MYFSDYFFLSKQILCKWLWNVRLTWLHPPESNEIFFHVTVLPHNHSYIVARNCYSKFRRCSNLFQHLHKENVDENFSMIY